MTKTVGIIGGGQLGRMLCLAAQKLNLKTIVLDPTPNSPAGQVSDKQIVGHYKEAEKILKLASQVDYLTFEIESTNAQILKELKKKGVIIEPPGETLEIIQDKYLQKEFSKAQKIPIPAFAKIDTKKDLLKFIKKNGYPIILKARFHAYDGRGNAVIKSSKDIKIAYQKLGDKNLYAEKYLTLKKELAIQIARTVSGEVKNFPLVETIQKNNICHIVKAPAIVSPKAKNKAVEMAKKTIEALSGAGVFGIELFLTKNGRIYLNEIAPRVHNSGHYTIEGCKTSQFEQHLRAVCNLPLGSVKMTSKAAVMINILGERQGAAQPVGIDKAKLTDGVFVHIYGKKETKIDRKMGHITVLAPTVIEALRKAKQARKLITI